MVDGDGGFERWLEQQLQQAAGQQGPSQAPSQAQYHAAYIQGGLHMSVLAKAIALVSSKGAIGLAVAALAVGAATAATETSVTGSTSPQNWGQSVVAQVQACKDALAPGSHGIGQCVSAFAKKHGPLLSADHANSARTDHPTSTDHPGNGNNPGQSTNHPGPPGNHPGGPPTSHP